MIKKWIKNELLRYPTGWAGAALMTGAILAFFGEAVSRALNHHSVIRSHKTIFPFDAFQGPHGWGWPWWQVIVGLSLLLGWHDQRERDGTNSAMLDASVVMAFFVAFIWFAGTVMLKLGFWPFAAWMVGVLVYMLAAQKLLNRRWERQRTERNSDWP